jgi:hypothetical protein
MRGRLRSQLSDAFVIHSRATSSLANPLMRRTLPSAQVATTDHSRRRPAGGGTTLKAGACISTKVQAALSWFILATITTTQGFVGRRSKFPPISTAQILREKFSCADLYFRGFDHQFGMIPHRIGTSRRLGRSRAATFLGTVPGPSSRRARQSRYAARHHAATKPIRSRPFGSDNRSVAVWQPR